MKKIFLLNEILILLFAILLSFISGYFVFSSKQDSLKTPQLPLLEKEISHFKLITVPTLKINFDSNIQYYNPSILIPSFHKLNQFELDLFKIINNLCINRNSILNNESLIQKQIKKTSSTINFEKIYSFQKMLCFTKIIPENFWKTQNIMHPSGKSFASIYLKNVLQKIYNKEQIQNWIQQHLLSFHLLELKDLIQNNFLDTKNDLKYKHLIQLKWGTLYSIAQRQDLIIDHNYILIHDSEIDSNYSFYPISTWDKFWKNTLFTPNKIKYSEVDAKNLTCFLYYSQICWELDYKKFLLQSWNPIFYLFLASIITLFILLFYLGFLIFRRKKEKDQLQFALEMLSHELRTPLANLNLQMEELRNEYKDLPSKTQKISLRIMDQIAQLLRLSHWSLKYLNRDSFINNKLDQNWILIPSLELYVKDCLEDFLEQIKFIYEKQYDESDHDSKDPIFLEPYWTMICLRNLIINAQKHGVPPIKVKVINFNNSWLFEVEDQGQFTFNPNQKGSKSTGLGLGLQIVRQIIPQLKGELFILFKPTRFQIHFQKVYYESNTPH